MKMNTKESDRNKKGNKATSNAPQKKTFSKTHTHNNNNKKRSHDSTNIGTPSKKTSSSPSFHGQKRKADTAFSSSSNNDHAASTTPANKKRALKLSRQATRPHSDIVLAAKEIWNQLRLHENTPEQVSALMTQLMKLLQGNLAQVACKHDASRVVQAALQFANLHQRTVIVQELCAPMMMELASGESGGSSKNAAAGEKKKKKSSLKSTSHLVELASSQYSHFIVLKMIKLCVQEPENIKTIVKAFKGSVLKLALHSVGARVMEDLFLTFPPKSTSILKLEFYGPQLTLFHTGEYSSGTIPLSQISLASILQKESETTQQSVLKFFHERVIVKGSEKKLYSFSFYQQLLWEYVAFVPLKMDIRTLSTTLCDHSLTLLSTRAGAKVVAECIAYGTPKERKRIIKSLKGYVRSSVLHSDAYIAILRLLDVTDDTVLIQKSILGELIVAGSKDKTTTKKQKIAAASVVDEEENEDEKEETIELKQEKEEEVEEDPEKSVESPLLEIALSESGCRVLLLLLAKTDEERNRYLDPWNLAMLHANPSVVEDGKEIPTSKKNHETRRTELLEFLKPSLIQLCQQHAAVLLPSKFGSRVQRAVYETWSSDILADAIVAACDEHLDDTHVANIFEHPFGHLVVKNLLLFESEGVREVLKDEEKSTRTDLHPLASKLHQKYKGQLRKAIASSNRGAFVLAALAAFPDATGKEVRKELKKNEKEISALLRGKDESQSSTAGYEALLKALS